MFVSPKTSITEFSGKTWFDRAFCQKNQIFKNKGPPRVFLVSLLVAPWAVPGLFIVRPRVSAIVQNVFGRYWCFAWSQLFSLNLSCDKLRYCNLTMLVKKTSDGPFDHEAIPLPFIDYSMKPTRFADDKLPAGYLRSFFFMNSIPIENLNAHFANSNYVIREMVFGCCKKLNELSHILCSWEETDRGNTCLSPVTRIRFKTTNLQISAHFISFVKNQRIAAPIFTSPLLVNCR